MQIIRRSKKASLKINLHDRLYAIIMIIIIMLPTYTFYVEREA